MGTIYQANCPCGFRQIDLLQGYGIQQGELHYVIYQCEQCHSLTSMEHNDETDSLFKPIRCPECKSSMSRLADKPQEHSYPCPECEQNSLQFSIDTLWD